MYQNSFHIISTMNIRFNSLITSDIHRHVFYDINIAVVNNATNSNFVLYDTLQFNCKLIYGKNIIIFMLIYYLYLKLDIGYCKINIKLHDLHRIRLRIYVWQTYV